MTTHSLSLKDFKFESGRTQYYRHRASLEDVCNSVCAFLNTSGGHVLIGADFENVYGIENADAYAVELRAMLLSKIAPLAIWQVDVVELQDLKQFVAVTVTEGSEKPYVSNRGIWIRNNNETIKALGTEASRLAAGQYILGERWERLLAAGVTFDDLDCELIREAASKGMASGRWKGDPHDEVAILSSLGLFFEGAITNAALVLFGKTPARLLPQVRVRLTGMPSGKTGARFDFDKSFEGPLLRIAFEVLSYIEDRLQDGATEFSPGDWSRKDYSKRIPQLALREGVMNALVHRDYALSGSVQISLLDDSLQISNPGNLPFSQKVSDLQTTHLSLPRNPDIAHVCFLFGLIEKVGRGTQFILEACEAENLVKPRWATTHTSTSLSFPFTTSSERIRPDSFASQKVDGKLAEILEKFRSLSSNEVSISEFAERMGKETDKRLVRYYLEKLVTQGYLKKLGARRSYKYSLIDADGASDERVDAR